LSFFSRHLFAMLVHRQPILAIVVLWSLSQMARAFRFTFGSPTQCDDLNILD